MRDFLGVGGAANKAQVRVETLIVVETIEVGSLD
jgi:hypothetical protein